MFFGWVLVAAALCCVCVAQTQRGVCTNDEYGFVTRFVRSGASFSQTSSAFAEPFLYTDCQSVRVGSEALRLCRATDCARVDLGFFVKEIDPTDEFSLRWCECGKPVPRKNFAGKLFFRVFFLFFFFKCFVVCSHCAFSEG